MLASFWDVLTPCSQRTWYALVENFTSMKTVAVQTALRINLSSQQHCSKVSWMHHYASTLKSGSVLSMMGVMAITAIIVVAEVKKWGKAVQFNNKVIHWAFFLSSKKKSCISIVQVFIVVPSLWTKYIAPFCTRPLFVFPAFYIFYSVRFIRCQDKEGHLLMDYFKTKSLICHASEVLKALT